MKRLKKSFSFLIAAAIVVTSLGAGIGVIKAKAAGPYTITLNANDGRTYDPIIVNEGETLSQLPIAKFWSMDPYFLPPPYILPKPRVEDKSFGVFQGWYLDNITYQQPIGRDYVPTSDMVLYGKWDLNIITFESNGGSPVTAITTRWNTQVEQPADPTKAGAAFVGWYFEETLENIVTWPLTLVQDTRVYAKWQDGNSSVITFNSNGGPAVSPIVAETGSSVPEPVEPLWANHVFGGWFTDAGLSNPVSWPYTLSADVTFYAKWTGVTSTVTFDAQGGTVSPATSTVTYGDTYAQGTGGMPTPSLSGYFFRGWFTEPDGAGTQVSGSTVVTITSPQTLYAKWTEHASDVYFIQFDGNGNTGGSTASCVCVIDEPSDLTPNGFVRTGYRWLGWAFDPEATTPDYAGDTIGVYNMTTTPNEVITLYAVWQIRSYDIWFDARGGTGGTSYLNVEYGSPLAAPAVTKTGYTLVGWSPAVPATVPAYHETYYAVWKANTYTIVYDGNGADGGSTPNSVRTYDDWARPLGPNGYTKAGCVLAGWATSPGGEVVYPWYASVNNLTSVPDAVVTLYAVWEPGTFWVNFVANGGTGSTSEYMTFGDPLTPPAVSRTGYTLAGWLPELPETVGPGDATYVAQWTPNNYTVIYDGNGNDDGSTASTVHTYDSYQPLAFNGYTKTGYNFYCWNTEPDGTGTSYQPAQQVRNLAAGGTVTLYAQWSINTHYVIFCPNGGIGDPIMQGITYGESDYLRLNTYTRPGYTFAGWNTEPDGSGTAWADGAYYGPVNSPNEWLYAQWSEAITYTLHYDGNTADSGSTADSHHVFDVAQNLTPNGFVKEGYSFAGWNTQADGSGTAYTDSQSVINLTDIGGATVTLYAQWTMIPADISEIETLSAPGIFIDMTGSTPILEGDTTQAGTVYWYGTPGQREAYNTAYLDALALIAESPMPDTAYNRGRIAAAAQALSDAIAVLYANPNPADYTYCDEEMAAAGVLNLNRYTLASLDELQAVADAVTAGKQAKEQSDVNTYTTGLYNGRNNLVPYNDTRSPWLNVLETDTAMAGIAIPGYDPEDYGNVSYVYPG
ncbi:MAG TPA: InlB B-repeat-containing protein, partial [Clostridiales bacterium]|nr:InlB B-repeat-containing protein [Clostridiales bacterium]